MLHERMTKKGVEAVMRTLSKSKLMAFRLDTYAMVRTWPNFSGSTLKV